MQWVKCVKHLGNYISYDLSEEEEIRDKKGDFIWCVNGLLIGYNDAHPEVKMYLLNSYCCHLYGSQSWSFSDSKTDQMSTEWNRGVKTIWGLHFESHRNILCGFNNGKHIWDCIFKRFCGMCESMTNSKNKKIEYLVKLGNHDCRTIIVRNIRVICDEWKVCEKHLWNKWKNASFCILYKSGCQVITIFWD